MSLYIELVSNCHRNSGLYLCFFLYSQLITPTPEEERTSEGENDSNTDTDGRKLLAIDTQQH